MGLESPKDLDSGLSPSKAVFHIYPNNEDHNTCLKKPGIQKQNLLLNF